MGEGVGADELEALPAADHGTDGPQVDQVAVLGVEVGDAIPAGSRDGRLGDAFEHEQVGSGAAGQPVGSQAAAQRVGAVVAKQPVVAGTPPDRVVTGPAAQLVGGGIAQQPVIVRRADHVLEVRQRVEALAPCQSVGEIHVERGGRGGIGRGVDARPAVERVAAAAAADHVVAVAAGDPVVAAAAQQHVVERRSGEAVVVRRAGQHHPRAGEGRVDMQQHRRIVPRRQVELAALAAQEQREILAAGARDDGGELRQLGHAGLQAGQRGVQRLDGCQGETGVELGVDGVDGVAAAAAVDQPALVAADVEGVVRAVAVEEIRAAAGSREVVVAGGARNVIVADGQGEVGHRPVERIERGGQDRGHRLLEDLGHPAECLLVLAVPVEGEGEAQGHPGRLLRVAGRHDHLPGDVDAAEVVPGDAAALAVRDEGVGHDPVEAFGHGADALELPEVGGVEEARLEQRRLVPADHVGRRGHHGFLVVDRILLVGRIVDVGLQGIPVDVDVLAGRQVGEQPARRLGNSHRRQVGLADQVAHRVGTHRPQDRVGRGVVAVADHRLEHVHRPGDAVELCVVVRLAVQGLVAQHRAADRADVVVDGDRVVQRQAVVAQVGGQRERLDRAADEQALAGLRPGRPHLVVERGPRRDVAARRVGDAVPAEIRFSVAQVARYAALDRRRRRARLGAHHSLFCGLLPRMTLGRPVAVGNSAAQPWLGRPDMAQRRIGVIINGATGRMGTTQHMANLLAIAAEGGLPLASGDRLVPELLLVGRDADRLKALARAHGKLRWTTSLDEAFGGPDQVFMDCAATGGRPARVRRAIAAGKHVFIEKPTAPTVEEAMALARLAERAGLRHGVIQDKLFLPGFAKLLALSQSGFFGRILSVRIDAGSWIFDGTSRECQRPSWNYRKAEGGGLALDMMAHWRYMIDRLAAPVTAVCALTSTAIPSRVDEQGRAYAVDAEDTSYALLRLAGGAVGMIANSWATRPRRDDTMVVQIDGTEGSAAAGRFRCFTQSAAETPEAFTAAARPGGVDLMAHWQEVPDAGPHREPVPPVLGGLPAPSRRGRTLPADPGRGRQGGAARRSRLSQHGRAALDGGARARAVSSAGARVAQRRGRQLDLLDRLLQRRQQPQRKPQVGDPDRRRRRFRPLFLGHEDGCHELEMPEPGMGAERADAIEVDDWSLVHRYSVAVIVVSL